jgi:hypothetical protein
MNRFIRTGLAASLTLPLLTGCYFAHKSDADKGGDDPALNAPTSSATSTAIPEGGGDVDTLWGKMKDPAPFLAYMHANEQPYLDSLTDNSIMQDGYVENYAYIACEDLRKGKTVAQTAADAKDVPELVRITNIMIRFICPDQKAKITS